jgi:hypothetical protein
VESQLALYYASYKHLGKLAKRNAFGDSKGNMLSKLSRAFFIEVGGWAMLRVVSLICKKRGIDLERAARHRLEVRLPQAPLLEAGS